MSTIVNLFSSLIGWIFRASTVKFIVFTALTLVLGPLMALLMQLVDSSGLANINGLVQAIPEGIRFYMAIFKFDVGLPMLVAAYLTRFFIRRLPIVG